MSKRVLLACLLAASAIAVYGVVNLDAHFERIIGGVLYHHNSYACGGTYAGSTGNQNQAAVFECTNIVTQLQYVCANSQGKITSGNNIRTAIHSIAGSSITSANVKENGEVVVRVTLPETAFQFAQEQCIARNRRWHAFAELILQSDLFLKVFNVEGTTQVQASEAWYHCGPPVDQNGVPYDVVTNPPPGNGVDTAYPCFKVAEAHCDKFPGMCPLPYTPEQFALRQEAPEHPFTLNASIHSLWNQMRKALRMARNEPSATPLAQPSGNRPIM